VEANIITHFLPFLDVDTESKFDFITAIYVLPHIQFNELESFIKKICSMLNDGGRFICIITSEKSFKSPQKNDKDLFNVVENNNLKYEGKDYKEILHKSMLPEIGYVYDYNRDEDLYVNMFSNNNFEVEQRKELNDGYFLHSLIIFRKK
jgi:cyclopropane fatty-acyl-phospholipid synthase-like methyltransferase